MASIRDFFNRIFRRNEPMLEEPKQETRVLRTARDITDYLKETNGIDFFYNEMDKMSSEQEIYRTMGAHDIDHTSRVIYLANTLAEIDGFTEKERRLLLTAARYHDIGRKNDKVDLEHGQYARIKIENNDLLKEFSKQEKEIIMFAVEQHSLSSEENEKAIKKLPARKREEYSKILSYLKDADALDRVRIANKNMQLDPNRLRTNTAKNLIEFSKETYNNFNFTIKNEYALRTFTKENPILEEAYELVKDSINPDWVINNQEYVIDLYNRGILNNLRKDDLYFLDFLEEDRYVKGAEQIEKGDFEYLINKGYNITFESFLEISSYYKEGTLEKLRKEHRLEDIFKKETFEKFGKERNLEEKLNISEISDEELLNRINKNSTVKLENRTFNDDYMIYKNMYEHHKDAFKVLEYIDLDINFKNVAGIIEKFSVNDINKLYQKGFKIPIENLIILASKFSPEEYRNIVNSDKIQDLFRYDSEKDKTEYSDLWKKLNSENKNISEEEFKENFALYKEILSFRENIYEFPEISNYSIHDIYPAYLKVLSAEEKLIQDGKKVEFSGKTILDVLEFSQKTKILDSVDEKEKENIIKLLIEDGKLKDDPRLIEYVTKKNKIYPIKNAENLYNYNKFCMEEILLDNNISLETAKSNLINSIFRIDIPNDADYKEEVEENIIDELYYYQKYKKSGIIESGNPKTKAEIEIDENIDKLLKIMDSATIKEFKDNLYETYNGLSVFNYDTVKNFTDSQLIQVSKSDIKFELEKTENMLNNSMNYSVEYQGEVIPVKVLNGQDFSIAMTTVMPRCSSITRKTLKGEKDDIKANMLNRKINPNNRCTTIINQNMIAHAMPELKDDELAYAYIPQNEESISLTGKHDLSTVKRNKNGVEQRVSNRSIQNRTLKDMVGTTDEEHNEMVLNNVYPRYIVCFDSISEVAMQKYKMLKEMYAQEGINQEIEILFIEGQKEYLPKIDEKLSNNLDAINKEVDLTGKISTKTLDKFFNKRENNILLQTIQSINSYSYRDDIWSQNNPKNKLDYLLSTFEKVGKVMPKEYIEDMMYQLDFLERKADRNDTRFGNRVYDHAYTDSIDVLKVTKIKDMLSERITGRHSQKEKQEERKIDDTYPSIE